MILAYNKGKDKTVMNVTMGVAHLWNIKNYACISYSYPVTFFCLKRK